MVHLNLVASLQPLLSRAEVAGGVSSRRVPYRALRCIHHGWTVKATWSQQPEQPWQDSAVVHNLSYASLGLFLGF